MQRAKLLVVDQSQEGGTRLAKALTQAGYEVALASTGSGAVGMLEWERPDIVVSHAAVGDMDGYELFTQVRRDPTTMDTPFLLLAGLDRPAALAAEEVGVEMVVTGELDPESVVRAVGALLESGAGQHSQRLSSGPIPRAASKPIEPLWTVLETAGQKSPGPAGAALQGSLEVMDLAEVTQAVALGGKTGCLVVHLTPGEGSIYFESGRIVHASFRGRSGGKAFADIISVSQRERDARFQFNRMERAEVTRGPKTISRSVEQLLLSIAVGIDEAEPGAGPLEGASPAPCADR
jgi:CheY-like chemotaxis protein